MDYKQIGIELEDDEKKIEEEGKDEKNKQKNKLKEDIKSDNKERKSLKEKQNEEENKQKKNQEVPSNKKNIKQKEKTRKNKKAVSKFLIRKRKRKEKKYKPFAEGEIKFERKPLAAKKESEMENSQSIVDLINIEPISDYVNKKIEIWNKNKSSNNFSIEELVKSISIIPEINYQFLNTIINKDIDKFFDYYKFFQFTFNASQRKEFQNKIKDKCDLPLIKNNFIPDTIKDIKEILVNLCNSIIKIECNNHDYSEKLKKVFMGNYVYSEGQFTSPIPVKYGNRELKINKLIFEIVDFFYPKSPMNVEDNDENELIYDKLTKFKLFQPIFEKIELYNNDEELISVFNYLFNSIFVYFDSEEKNRDYELFKYIILCCMPFELKKAKIFLIELKKIIKRDKVFINDIDLKNYNIENIKAESKVYFKEKDICVNFKDINCYLNPIDFMEYLKGNKFMICFRYPKLASINYLHINDKIRKSYNELFNKIMKSETMKQAMNIDKEAKQFKYPFDNDAILNEVENNCYMVPLPATNYFGISDKVDYSIYLNSIINTSSYDKIFIDIDSITKSKCHEIKHIYRIYMNIYNPEIGLKTPEIKYKKLETNELTKDSYNFFKKKEDIISEIYSSKRVRNTEIDELDYGDVLEFAINGKKQNVYFILNSLFCLSEKSWEMKKGDFMVKYFKTCFKEKFRFEKKKDNIFIKEIINYFKISTGSTLENNPDTSKSSSKEVPKESNSINNIDEIDNNYYYIFKASHFRK